MPPFDGPRATLCVTRYPLKTRVLPWSIDTGTDTSTAFLHSPRTSTRLGSTLKVAATRRSCSRAISNGFSRRCEAGCATAVTESRVYGYSSQSEPNGLPARFPALDRVRDDPDDVVAGSKPLPVRVAPGEPERVAAGEHVAQQRERPDLRSVGAPEDDVESLQRDDLRVPGDREDAACVEREECGLRVGGGELRLGDRHAADQAPRPWTEGDRPRDADRPAAEDAGDHGTVRGRGPRGRRRGDRAEIHDHALAWPDRHVRGANQEVDGGGTFVLRPDRKRRVDCASRKIGERNSRLRAPPGTARASERKRARRRRDLACRGRSRIRHPRALHRDRLLIDPTRRSGQQA